MPAGLAPGSGPSKSRRLFRRLSLLSIALVAGCEKPSEREVAEQKAIARHQQESQQIKELQSYFRDPNSPITKALRALISLHDQGQLPGVGKEEHGVARLELPKPVGEPKSPYFWSQEFHFIIQDSPPRHCHYVVVQAYPNGDYQLQKAWRTDEAGKVIQEYTLAAPKPRTDPRRLWLGPANAGAEQGWAGWYYGVLGGGFVGISADDPAVGLSCFELGITNAVAGTDHHADFRSEQFSLGASGRPRQRLTLSFAYKLPEKVKPGDNIEVHLRFFDESRQ